VESYIDIIKFAITALIAVLGWLAGHYFSDKRDRSNKKRELTTKHLINAYSVLTNEVSHRKQTPERQQKPEYIITEIQLFGSAEQVILAKKLANEVAAGREFELDPLINSLRTDLRIQLELEPINGNVTWLRFKE
jgi:hypothetical protein